MKAFQLICILCLFIYTYQQCFKLNAQKEDCKKENFDSDEKEAKKEYCCYYKNGDTTACTSLTKYQYEHIKDWVKSQKLSDYNIKDDAEIDCKSFYLEFNILVLLFILLL
jgi:hypothetical protein